MVAHHIAIILGGGPFIVFSEMVDVRGISIHFVGIIMRMV